MARRSLPFRAVLFVLVSIALANQSNTHPRTQNTPVHRQGCCGGEVGERELDFPYYSLADGFTSTLNLVRDSPKPLDFILVFHGQSGTTTAATPMTIMPSAKMAVDVKALLTKLNADITGDFAQGSIAALFEGTVMPLVGQVTITNPKLHLVQESEMVENDPGRSDVPAVLSGVWWGIGGGRDARIMVTNASASAAVADIYLDFQGSRHNLLPLNFVPNEMKILSVTDMLNELGFIASQAPEGGITIIQRGPNPRLIAQGRITDPATGFSTTIEFPDPARQRSSGLHASRDAHRDAHEGFAVRRHRLLHSARDRAQPAWQPANRDHHS